MTAARFDRRALLVAALLGAVSSRWRAAPRSRAAARSTTRRAASANAPDGRELSEPDRVLASLGATLAAADPSGYRALRREAALGVAFASLAPGSRSRAQRARSRLLDRTRIQADFARGRVVVANGWVLARSEAAAAAYLHALSNGS